MLKVIKFVWNTFTTLLLVVLVILAIMLVGVRLFGYQPYTVLSGSMEPTYHVGSLIYVKAVDHTTLGEGDVITFMASEDTVATHRIMGVVPDEDEPDVLRYRTKGDANAVEDGTMVHYKNIIGTPVFSIPRLGYLANYIQNPPGMYIAVSVGAVILLIDLLPDLFAPIDEEEKKGKKKKKESADV